MIALDTSALIDCVCGVRPLRHVLGAVVSSGERVVLPVFAYYEWRRGPRLQKELARQERIVPDHWVLGLYAEEAELAAEFFRTLPRARARSADFLIAACAIANHARLWTQNRADFEDIPGLVLFDPPSA